MYYAITVKVTTNGTVIVTMLYTIHRALEGMITMLLVDILNAASALSLFSFAFSYARCCTDKQS